MDIVGLILLEISSLKHSGWITRQNVKNSSGSLKVWCHGIVMIILLCVEGEVWICKPNTANQVHLVSIITAETNMEVLGKGNFLS